MASDKKARSDKFGRPFVAVPMADKMSKSGAPFPTGYLELGGKLYQLQLTKAADGKEDKRGRSVRYWVTVTKLEKRNLTM